MISGRTCWSFAHNVFKFEAGKFAYYAFWRKFKSENQLQYDIVEITEDHFDEKVIDPYLVSLSNYRVIDEEYVKKQKVLTNQKEFDRKSIPKEGKINTSRLRELQYKNQHKEGRQIIEKANNQKQ